MDTERDKMELATTHEWSIIPETGLPFVGREPELMELLFQLTRLQGKYIQGQAYCGEDDRIKLPHSDAKTIRDNAGRVIQYYGPEGIGKTELTSRVVEIAEYLKSPVVTFHLNKANCDRYKANPADFFTDWLVQLDKLDKNGSLADTNQDQKLKDTLFLITSRYVGELTNKCSDRNEGECLREWKDRPMDSSYRDYWKFYESGWVDKMIATSYFLNIIGYHVANRPITFLIQIDTTTPPGLIELIEDTIISNSVALQHLVVLTSQKGIRLRSPHFRDDKRNENSRQVLWPIPCLNEEETRLLTSAAGLTEEDKAIIYQLTGGYPGAVIAGIAATREIRGPTQPELKTANIIRTIKEQFFDAQVFAHLDPNIRKFVYALALFKELHHNEIYAISRAIGLPDDLPSKDYSRDNPYLIALRECLVCTTKGLAMHPAFAVPLGQYLRLCEQGTVLQIGQAYVDYHEAELQKENTIPGRLGILISLLGTVDLVGSDRMTNYVERLEEEMRRLKQHIAEVPLNGEQVHDFFGKYFDRLKIEPNLISAIGDKGVEGLIKIATSK